MKVETDFIASIAVSPIYFKTINTDVIVFIRNVLMIQNFWLNRTTLRESHLLFL